MRERVNINKTPFIFCLSYDRQTAGGLYKVFNCITLSFIAQAI